MAANTLLKLTDVTKRFGGIRAIDHVSLDVDEGELVGLIGPNGAGKSTLMNLITGRYPVTDGRIEFAGENITSRAQHEVANRGISRTFQTVRHFEQYPAYLNIAMGLYENKIRSVDTFFSSLRGADEEEEERIAEAAMGVGIDLGKLETLPSEMSHLDRTKVSLARVLVQDSQLLLLDEPFAGLTAEEVDTLADTLVNLHQEAGKTIVIVDHNIDEVSSLTDRLIVLQNGSILRDGSPQEVLEAKIVQQAYLGA